MSKETNSLEALELDLKKFSKALREASQTVINEGVSKYPIFIVHKDELNIGILLIEPAQSGSHWSFSISTMEEFVTKKLIQDDKVASFQKAYKDPEINICLFVIDPTEANFIFVPYKPREVNN